MYETFRLEHYKIRGFISICMKKYGITQSMLRKGNCLDNAVMENVLVYEIRIAIFIRVLRYGSFQARVQRYINYYKNDCIKLKLNVKSPV